MIVWPLLNLNFACEKCQTGHRNGSCAHTDRKLLEIRSKGRPTSQCSHCRARRKEGVGHSHHRCMCGDGSTILRKKVQVHFDPNVILVFTPERSNVDALRKQLEDTPKSTLLIRRKAKGGKGTGGEGSEADALEISYTHVDVIEESVNLDLKKMMENPCTCQFGGTCICSELPPSKSCGSVKAKKFTASNSAQRPGLASSALLANIAAYPRPIEIGPPPTSSPFPYAAGIAIPALPPMMGHQPILPMPHPGQLGPLVPPIGGASTAVMNQRVPTLLPSGLSMPTNPSFAGAMKSNQQFTDTGGHDPELLSALFALQQGGAVVSILQCWRPKAHPAVVLGGAILKTYGLPLPKAVVAGFQNQNLSEVDAVAAWHHHRGMLLAVDVRVIVSRQEDAAVEGHRSQCKTAAAALQVENRQADVVEAPVVGHHWLQAEAALAVVHQAVVDARGVVVDAQVEDVGVHPGALTSREAIWMPRTQRNHIHQLANVDAIKTERTAKTVPQIYAPST
ncbi:uncharacterized protein SPPG_07448 [Spizellomyces punctatus DAOM BR117]|uniref:Copper-fist domain-containing protein n=1 Tax=Spizellomyces punctatus (strain DAOM BR117) TaxID=645134 RepID=A0A0L0H7Z1_SPIPD|nr:uncharacterized protein SPPG_07448 [Spizellomyces punctatus DAOM BR117]KNC97051.1 hypothetical protein SPPG_07448 [Spizellomyces punctatus DAOM BR117]|eukprot:XP_016605091.1 hypothetical protein SPPG_07448 [Spizellomyces punctatus DAOM BR117]